MRSTFRARRGGRALLRNFLFKIGWLALDSVLKGALESKDEKQQSDHAKEIKEPIISKEGHGERGEKRTSNGTDPIEKDESSCCGYDLIFFHFFAYIGHAKRINGK